MGLNEKQRVFAEYYAASLNATESAKRAGYSEKTARSIGQRLLTNVDIKKYIQDLSNNARNKRVADLNEVLEYLSDTMRNAEEQTKERTKAAQILKDMLGSGTQAEDSGIAVQINIADCGGENHE